MTPGASADKRPIVDLGLPDKVLTLLVQRGSTAFVPQGSTLLRAGDRLLTTATPTDTQALRQVLEIARTAP